MFVEINNSEMNVPRVLDWINRTKKANNNVISPEFAMEILGKTNFFGHIKTVLKNIKENCKTKEDILPYKEFILSCVDGREMSDQAMEDLVAMAKLCCCKDEFEGINKKTKLYRINDCDGITVNSIDEFDDLDVYTNVFFNFATVHLSYCKLDKYKGIKFLDGALVYLEGVENLYKNLDVSMCSKVDLGFCDISHLDNLRFRDGADVDLKGVEELPHYIDLSRCSKVNLYKCDLSQIDNLRFRDGADVCLQQAENIPQDLDATVFSKIDFSGCELAHLNELRFREGAEVYFYTMEYNLSLCVNKFPKFLDFSNCSIVDLSFCNVEDVEEIKFGNCKKVKMASTKGLSGVLDLSGCDEVDLAGCDLSEVDEIKFKKGAKVKLNQAYLLPEKIDFSECSDVDLSYIGEERAEMFGLCLNRPHLPEVLDFSNAQEVCLNGSDLSGVREIKFNEGSNVSIRSTEVFCDVLDLSMCAEVDMLGCDLLSVNVIKFKDKEQEKEFMTGAKSFMGKVEYVGEKEKPCIQKNNFGSLDL